MVRPLLEIDLLPDGLLAGVAGFGAMQTAGPAAKDAAMEAAFGDPNADETFLGSELSGRYLLGAATGGRLGSALMATAPMDAYKMNPYIPNPVQSGAIGAAAGGAAGALGGFMFAAKKAAATGTKSRGKLAAAMIGGAIGGAVVGGTALGIGTTGSAAITYAGMNRNFFANSPYANTSSGTAAALNASGNIVLGMHNSRNGY